MSQTDNPSCDHCGFTWKPGDKMYVAVVRFSAWPRTANKGIWDGHLCDDCIKEVQRFLNIGNEGYVEQGKAGEYA